MAKPAAMFQKWANAPLRIIVYSEVVDENY